MLHTDLCSFICNLRSQSGRMWDRSCVTSNIYWVTTHRRSMHAQLQTRPSKKPGLSARSEGKGKDKGKGKGKGNRGADLVEGR